MSQDLVYSIDLGTMGVKLCLVSFDGTIKASAASEYPIISNSPGEAEQDPLDWWKGIVSCSKRLAEESSDLLSNVRAVSICGQMHTHVYLDRDRELLGNAITWMDQRSTKLLQEWETKGVSAQIFDSTWNAPSTTYTVPQVCWMKKHKPELVKNTHFILLAKDYLKFLMTGKMVTDPSDASGVGTFDIRTNEWSSEAFHAAGIEKSLFPPVHPSTSVIGKLTPMASQELCLKEGIPVLNGGSDHSVAEIGSGMLSEDTLSCIVGTAGVVAACVSKPIKDEEKRIMCWSYPIDGFWDLLGITQTAASCLTWFRDTFDPDQKKGIFEEYSRMADKAKPGSEGLVFLPYLIGERTPLWDSHAKGVFFGIQLKHRKEHFIRSIMEGVAYSLKDCMDVMSQLSGASFDTVSLTGGGSKSRVWREIQSDVFGVKTRTLQTSDTGAIGNLILALIGLGEIEGPADAAHLIRPEETQDPCLETSRVYQDAHRLYHDIYNNTRNLMRETEELS